MWKYVILIFGVACTLHASKLDLSWSGLTKEKFFRDSNWTVSDRIEQATELNLRGNLFDRFSDCSANLDKLQVLDLSQNQLQRFFFVCKNEDNLYKLNVSHNQLPFLNDTALTDRMTRLQILDLSFNLVQIVTTESFQHLKNLDFLTLQANPIGNNIASGAFRNLTSLEQLDLRNISTSKFPEDLFLPLVSLRRLSLAANPIETVPNLPARTEVLDLSRTNILHLRGIDVSHLRVLTMNNMPRLESLNLNDLGKLPNLTVLSIENCHKLRNLTIQPPRGDVLPELIHLSIKNCSIDNVGMELRPVMQRASSVDLQENPWYCDCRMLWILSLNSTKSYTNGITCTSPSALSKKRVYDVPVEEFECMSYYDSYYVVLWMGVGILILALAVATLLMVTRGSLLKKWHMRLRRGDTVSYRNIVATSNEGDKILENCDMADYP